MENERKIQDRAKVSNVARGRVMKRFRKWKKDHAIMAREKVPCKKWQKVNTSRKYGGRKQIIQICERKRNMQKRKKLVHAFKKNNYEKIYIERKETGSCKILERKQITQKNINVYIQ